MKKYICNILEDADMQELVIALKLEGFARWFILLGIAVKYMENNNVDYFKQTEKKLCESLGCQPKVLKVFLNHLESVSLLSWKYFENTSDSSRKCFGSVSETLPKQVRNTIEMRIPKSLELLNGVGFLKDSSILYNIYNNIDNNNIDNKNIKIIQKKKRTLTLTSFRREVTFDSEGKCSKSIIEIARDLYADYFFYLEEDIFIEEVGEVIKEISLMKNNFDKLGIFYIFNKLNKKYPPKGEIPLQASPRITNSFQVDI